MTESNQGPATPGTAARCETCGWLRGYGRGLCAAHIPDYYDYEISACFKRGYERLKAENASLRADLAIREDWLADFRKSLTATEEARASILESLRAAEQLAESRGRMLSESMALHEKANRDLFAAEQRAEAAEKRNTELQGVLRAFTDTAEVILAVALDDQLDEGIHAKQLRARITEARAALHDEERSAPPPISETISEGPPRRRGETIPETKPETNSAAQGEEK